MTAVPWLWMSKDSMMFLQARANWVIRSCLPVTTTNSKPSGKRDHGEELHNA